MFRFLIHVRRCFAHSACAVAFIAAADLDARAAPRIAAPETTSKFGWRDSAETVTNRFALRNDGDTPLYISDVRVSCGCSRAEPARRELAPGERTTLAVRTALRGLHGAVRKSVTVVSNDPDTPYLTLWIEGEARAAVCLEPDGVSFGRINPHDPPPPLSVRLAGYATNATIAAVTCDPPLFPITVAPDARAFTVHPPAARVPGAQRALAQVALSDPNLSGLGIHLYAWVDDLIRVVPVSLAFSPGPTPAGLRLVVVRPGTVRRFLIKQAALEYGTGDVSFLPRPDGSYHVRLDRVVPDSLATNAALVIQTDLPEHPEWRVPLRVEGHRPAP